MTTPRTETTVWVSSCFWTGPIDTPRSERRCSICGKQMFPGEAGASEEGEAMCHQAKKKYTVCVAHPEERVEYHPVEFDMFDMGTDGFLAFYNEGALVFMCPTERVVSVRRFP